MAKAPLTVIYEDNHLLVVAKPALLPTMGVAAGEPTLLSDAKEYLRRKYHKPGNVYLGVVSRLDAPVTGLVLLARTSKAAARLTDAFRQRQVEKIYWGVVSGVLEPRSGRCVDWLAKDERHRRMHVVSAKAPGAQRAELTYRTLREESRWSLLEVHLETGRKHQIRLQLSARGHPIAGDLKYGSSLKFSPGISLHARRLVLDHPVRGTRLELTAPLPASWRRWGFQSADLDAG